MVKNATGHVVRQGLADCHCVVDQSRGGIFCSGRNRTVCFEDIEEWCQQNAINEGRKLKTAVMYSIIVFIVSAVMLIFFALAVRRFMKTKKYEQLRQRFWPRKSSQQESAGEPETEGRHIRHGAIPVSPGIRTLHDNDDIEAAQPLPL